MVIPTPVEEYADLIARSRSNLDLLSRSYTRYPVYCSLPTQKGHIESTPPLHSLTKSRFWYRTATAHFMSYDWGRRDQQRSGTRTNLKSKRSTSLCIAPYRLEFISQSMDQKILSSRYCLRSTTQFLSRIRQSHRRRNSGSQSQNMISGLSRSTWLKLPKINHYPSTSSGIDEGRTCHRT